MTPIPTTTLATWVNIQPNGSGTTPDAYVAEGLGDYVTDYDVEAITGEMLAQLEQRLPAGLFLLGNGELIGDAYGPNRDTWPTNLIDHIRDLLDDIDLQGIADGHDLTERAAQIVVYRLNPDGGRGAAVLAEPIEDPQDAHKTLRTLDEDRDHRALPGTEYGDPIEAVVLDATGTTLATARAAAR